MLIENLMGFLTDNLGAHIERLVGKGPDFQGLQIDGIHLNAVSRSAIGHHVVTSEWYVAPLEHHLVANKRIVVEIETGVAPLTAGLSARLHDRHLLGHDSGGEEQQQNGN